MDLNLLECFYYVAREESISSAAKIMYISQPAVSQKIKILENELGIELFIRKKRGVTLSNDGKIIYEQCKKIFNDFNDLKTLISDLKSGDEGILRIGASDTICKYYLIDQLKSFEKLHPNVSYRVTNCTTSESIELLENQKVDIAFIHSPIENKNLSLQNIHELNDIFVSSVNFDTSKIKSIKDITKYRTLLLEKASTSRKFLDDSLLKLGIVLKPKFELASLDVLIEFAKNNMGIISVPQEYVKDEIEENLLKPIITKEKLEPRYISLALKEDHYRSITTKKFIDFLTKR